MALSENAFRALQDIVGGQNISRDPVVLESYNYYFLGEAQGYSDGTRFTPLRPGAVILPKSTEEVQAIVKVCNQFKLKTKAQSTNFGVLNTHFFEDEIIIDLRRLNRIIEIDEKNRYAVVEPYVSWAQLQAETMKVGLTPAIPGVGCHCSVLANLVSYGTGPYSWYAGFGDKYALSVEWVLPDGELLRLGSLSSGGGWFCGDGPGPSLRGLLRGEYGALGAMGVITKAATKLWDLPGLNSMPIQGSYPDFQLDELPSTMEVYLLTWKSREKRGEAILKLGEEGIGYHLYSWGIGYLATAVPELEFLLPWKSGKPLPEEHFVAMTLVCHSHREKRYQDRALKTILESTEGAVSPLILVPGVKQTIFRFLVRPDLVFLTTFRFASGWFDTLYDFLGVMDTVNLVQNESLEIAKTLEGKAVLPGVWDTSCEPIFEYAHTIYTECGGYYDAADPQSVKDWLSTVKAINGPLTAKKIMRPSIGSSRANIRAGQMMSNYHIWQGKLKAAFDPNYVCDAHYYIEPLVEET